MTSKISDLKRPEEQKVIMPVTPMYGDSIQMVMQDMIRAINELVEEHNKDA